MEFRIGADLIAELSAGDERAFAALYDTHAPQLLRAAWGILGCRDEAEDVVQDVFVELARSRERLASILNLNAYLFTSMRRAAIRRSNSRRSERRTISQIPPPENNDPKSEQTAQDDQTERLHLALQSLPAEQRELVVLKIDGGLTFDQLAEIFEISPNTAASRYRYGLEKLRASLREQGLQEKKQ